MTPLKNKLVRGHVMLSLTRRFMGDQNGFCGSEYALVALVGITIALYTGYNYRLKTSDVFERAQGSLAGIIEAKGAPAACAR
jgi:Flp pilus assembly pilin Flp